MGVKKNNNEESGFERDQKSEVQLQVVATKECSKYSPAVHQGFGFLSYSV